MAQTFKQACSDIINDLRSYNLDDRLSYRAIKNKLIDAASYFTKQDAEMRKLFRLSNLWKPIECVELEEVNLSNCGGNGCKKIMRSVCKIPESYQTGYGHALKVFNRDYSKEYLPIQPSFYKDIKARPFSSKNGYFWISDNYLYIPDSEVEAVTILGMFKEDAYVCDSGECIKPLDSTFSFPDYIVKIAKDEVLSKYISTKQVPVDENPDLDTNTKK